MRVCMYVHLSQGEWERVLGLVRCVWLGALEDGGGGSREGAGGEGKEDRGGAGGKGKEDVWTEAFWDCGQLKQNLQSRVSRSEDWSEEEKMCDRAVAQVPLPPRLSVSLSHFTPSPSPSPVFSLSPDFILHSC